MLKKEETEKAVLSNAISKNECLFQLLEHDSDIFTDVKNKKIFETIRDLVNSDSPVSINTVSASCNIDHSYFVELAMYNAYEFENKKLLQELSKLAHERHIYKLAHDLFLSVKHGEKDFDKFLNEVSDLQEKENELESSEDISIFNDEEIDDICHQDNYKSTGLKSLDSAIVGIKESDLITIAGKTGGGKTTLALNIACNMKNSLIISYEMPKKEIYIKLLARYSGVNSLDIEKLHLSQQDRKKINEAKKKIADLKLRVISCDYLFPQLLVKLKKEFQQHNYTCIVVDYIQLIGGAKGANEKDQMVTMTRAFKNFSMRHGVPIIQLSQMTKESWSADRDPNLSDLYGSASIANNSNGVIFADNGIINAKARGGEVGRIANIGFNKPTSEFFEKKLDEKTFNKYTDAMGYIHE